MEGGQEPTATPNATPRTTPTLTLSSSGTGMQGGASTVRHDVQAAVDAARMVVGG